MAGVITLCLAGVFALVIPDAPPRHAPGDTGDTGAGGGVFLYYGSQGETHLSADAAPHERDAALAALDGVSYFAAFAAGPSGSTGVWTNARNTRLARAYALAACGENCRIVADRVPRPFDRSRSEPVATPDMAQSLAVKWPFSKDVVAIGGANAWGHRRKSGGKMGWTRSKREALAECERHRAAEAAPDPDLSPPCRVLRLKGFEDMRPKPVLYPAAYVMGLTELRPVSETRIMNVPGAPEHGWFTPYRPPRLHGARAANGASSSGVVRQAGWPEAGDRIALLKCNAARRAGEPVCAVTHRRVPDSLSADVLGVPEALYDAYLAWRDTTTGAGAFALSPYGVWGFSHDHADVESAVQKAADWCWYHTRRNWEYRQVARAFLDAGLACRIVAVRDR